MRSVINISCYGLFLWDVTLEHSNHCHQGNHPWVGDLVPMTGELHTTHTSSCSGHSSHGRIGWRLSSYRYLFILFGSLIGCSLVGHMSDPSRAESQFMCLGGWVCWEGLLGLAHLRCRSPWLHHLHAWRRQQNSSLKFGVGWGENLQYKLRDITYALKIEREAEKKSKEGHH